MSFLKYLLTEEASEKRKDSWAGATEKRREKLKTAGLYEGRFWIKHSTNKGLQTLKERYEVEQVGQVIDRLVSAALKGK